ncbi:MAG: hypothetical protein AAGA36_02770 [Pseudomonadota bacterium]
MKTLIALACAASLLASCGEDAAEASRNAPAIVDVDLPGDLGRRAPGTFLAAYQATKTAAPAPAVPIDWDGQWRGYVTCNTSIHPVTLTIAANAATITLENDILRPKRAAFYGTSFEDASGTFVSMPASAHGKFSTPYARGELTGVLAVDPQAADRAYFQLLLVQGRRGVGYCRKGRLVRGAEGDLLAKQLDAFTFLGGRPKAIIQGACPPAMKALRDAALTVPKDRYRRPVVVDAMRLPALEAVLGGPYETASGEALSSAARKIRGSCLPENTYDGARLDRATITQFTQILKDPQTYADLVLSKESGEILAAWSAWVAGELDRGAPFRREDTIALINAPRQFGMGDLGLNTDFAQSARTLAAGNRTENRADMFVTLLERAHNDFEQLLTLSENARARGTVDPSVTALALDHYLIGAAESYAEEATRTNDRRAGLTMITWAATQRRSPEGCPAKTPEVCSAAANVLIEASIDIADHFAAVETPKVNEAVDARRSLAALADVVTMEDALDARYGGLMDLGDLADLSEDLQTRRYDLHDDLEDDLIEIAEDATITRTLSEAQTAYFQPGDLDRPELEDISAAFAEAQSKTQPFQGLAFASYFNALYNEDFPALMQLDQDATARLRPLLQLGGQQMALYGDLADAILGRQKGTSAARIDRAMRNFSVLYAVLGTYLTEYQTRYATCLGRNAAGYTITKRTDIVTRNGFGAEIKRTPGWTTEDSYRIPAKFKPQFDALFSTATENDMSKVLDLFLNDNTISRLRDATRQLMETHRCDSPEIQQFETGLQSYDADLQRRLGG